VSRRLQRGKGCREQQTTRSPGSARQRRCPGSAEAASAALPGTASLRSHSRPRREPDAQATAGRRRPSRDAYGVPVTRGVAMPHSTSWPSRHAASAFAFATTAGAASPWAAAPLAALAALVAYPRVHTGVHCPLVVIARAVAGVAAARVAAAATRRLLTPWASIRVLPHTSQGYWLIAPKSRRTVKAGGRRLGGTDPHLARSDGPAYRPCWIDCE
jgi:hypothetical protein